VHSHRTLTAEVRQLLGIQAPGDRPMLVGAPVGHAIGMLAGLLGPPYRSQPVHLMDVWEPDAVLDAMVAADLTAGAGATYFCQSLLDAPGFGPEHIERMRHIGLGGAAVPAAFADRAEGLGIGIARSYGSTEHPSVTGSQWAFPREKRNHTDGRPLAGVELRLVDDAGQDVAPGTAGEIWSRGPELFTGYTDPALTKEAVDADGWYASGDIGVRDPDGFLTITDRKKDIIIRGGENVSAAEVEELLVRMPGVAEAAAVAAPDARLGEHVCAFVRTAPNADAPNLTAVREHLDHAGLARQKWPEELHVVDELPRTPSGKVKKYVLRDLLRSEHQ
jgi:acyl-CoA synthetase (AMP-forming)/AMP-acid ligase II